MNTGKSLISLMATVRGVLTVEAPSPTQIVNEYKLRLSKSITPIVDMIPVTEIVKTELLAPVSEYVREEFLSSSVADAWIICVPMLMFSSITALNGVLTKVGGSLWSMTSTVSVVSLTPPFPSDTVSVNTNVVNSSKFSVSVRETKPVNP